MENCLGYLCILPVTAAVVIISPIDLLHPLQASPVHAVDTLHLLFNCWFDSTSAVHPSRIHVFVQG